MFIQLFLLQFNLLFFVLVIDNIFLRVLMHVTKGVKVALKIVTIVTRSNFTGGMVQFKDKFKGHNIMYSIVGLLK